MKKSLTSMQNAKNKSKKKMSHTSQHHHRFIILEMHAILALSIAIYNNKGLVSILNYTTLIIAITTRIWKEGINC